MPLQFKLKSKSKKNFKSFVVIFGIFIVAGLILMSVRSAKTEEDGIAKPAIAIIQINGEIMSGGSADPAELVKLIREADSSYATKAIIFEINSPGGTVVASKEIADAVKNTKKPTVAWIKDVGASGAYWISSACDKIVADEASITGSIGVIGSYLQYSGLFEKYGITYEQLVSGAYKDTGSPYKQMTAAERSYMQSKINKISEFFIDAVAENRGMSRPQISALANGQIFLGVEAKELGLIDVLGGKEEAQKTAEQLAGLKSSKLVTYASPPSLFELLSGKINTMAYWMGKGMGSSIVEPAIDNSNALMAEIY